MSSVRPPDPAAESEPGAENRPAPLPARRLDETPAPRAARDEKGPARPVTPVRLEPLLPHRQRPQLLVEVDGTPATYGGLIWALREAARREAVVVAIAVLDAPDGDPLGSGSRVSAREHAAAHDRAAAVLLRAIAETGVQGRSRCAVMDRAIYDALTAAGRGADLVVVGSTGKALLRHTVPGPPLRRLARGA
jgi:nucleotide-binding universal stress UspA family protein